MKSLLAAAALAALFVAGQAAAASPAEGLWRTETNNGEVLITDCGGTLCGKVTTSDRIKNDPTLADVKNPNPALRTRTLKDLQILQGFKGGPSEWKGGTVYKPEDGRTYKGSIKVLDNDTLKLTGCVIWPACASQTWKRIR